MSELYEIELETEVATWLDGLSDKHFGKVNDAAGVLAELGPATPMPLAQSLRDGVRELRLTLGDVEARITYWITPDRRIIFLTYFRKTRLHEERQINRAVLARKTCEAEHGPAHDIFDRDAEKGEHR
ncbi:type II toxin-antitoxin system RelE/ParE family toxin [Streptomyces scopuliridis]|uniref:type II toxin-antitoxin system RelE/ParE family toxin n=1 Tax=Streptomyces scopuliridis TaxID=452529 RepID=UPI00368232F1